MTTITEFCQMLTADERPVVTFKPRIEEKESYAEESMRARILGFSIGKNSGVIELHVDFEEFASHNAQFESDNYYDANRQPTLTARQAGFYKPQDGIYFDPAELVEDFFTVNASSLHEKYLTSGAACSYVEWLEQKVVELQN